MSARRAALALALVLGACAAPRPAPVVDRGPAQPAPPPEVSAPQVPEPAPAKALPTHTVKRGETLVGIALQHGLDYRELAAWNGITNLARLSVGQVLVLAPPPAMGGPAAPPGATPLAPGPGAP
ncbi:MAG TPA: LysM peptidoglycan-binding domain-containing protein, partial [Usitatibacter sp.]|nr:LysM peptidoglycan-binding domain-containing protein [Usitatibacter sp.]